MKLQAIPITHELTETQKNNVIAWIAALRSGTYTQGAGSLRLEFSGDCAFCCLGVACEIKSLERFEDDSYLVDGNIYEGLPSNEWMREQFGFDASYCPAQSVDIEGRLFPYSLYKMNDELMCSFDEIATIIEAAFILKKPITIDLKDDDDTETER